jgi:phenylalanyl-tRNA synthetase beta chain
MIKITWNWLKQHLNFKSEAFNLLPISPESVALILTERGFETSVAACWNFGNQIRIAHILSCIPHPSSQHLKICTVDAGEGFLRTIVCGAENARADLYSIVALPGALLPGCLLPLKEIELKGIKSEGMLASPQELNLSASFFHRTVSDGIVEWDALWRTRPQWHIGASLQDILGGEDWVFDVDITPNRGDLFSVYGIARLLAGWNYGTLKPLEQIYIDRCVPEHQIVISKTDSDFCWNIHITPEAQTVVNALALVHITTPEKHLTPFIIQRFFARLNRHLIGSPVDIANFVMMDLGQPLHIWNKHQGNCMEVSVSSCGTFTDLKYQKHQLIPGDLVTSIGFTEPISLKDGVSDLRIAALPGIIGDHHHGWSSEGTEWILEAGLFQESVLSRTGQRLCILSDARTRGERGLDPNMLLQALNYAARWIVSTGFGVIKQSYFWSKKETQIKQAIIFEMNDVMSRTGCLLSKDDIYSRLKSLGYVIEHLSHDPWTIQVYPPSWRNDVYDSEDLVEDLMQWGGYDQIPTCLLPLAPVSFISDDMNKQHDVIEACSQILAHHGFHEVITYPWLGIPYLNVSSDKRLLLMNPLGEESNMLRTSLIPSLLSVISRNLVRIDSVLGVFERGSVFLRNEDQLPQNENHITFVCSAEPWPYEIQKKELNLVDVKKILWDCMHQMAINPEYLEFSQNTTNNPQDLYHPFRSAEIGILNHEKKYEKLASWGEIHPNVLHHGGIKGRWMACECILSVVWKAQILYPLKDPSLSDQPYIKRDLAFWIPKTIPLGAWVKLLKETAGTWCVSCSIFDIFQDHLSEKCSVGCHFTFQHPTRTLTDEEIQNIMNACISKAEQEGGVLRDGK